MYYTLKPSFVQKASWHIALSILLLCLVTAGNLPAGFLLRPVCSIPHFSQWYGFSVAEWPLLAEALK